MKLKLCSAQEKKNFYLPFSALREFSDWAYLHSSYRKKWELFIPTHVKQLVGSWDRASWMAGGRCGNGEIVWGWLGGESGGLERGRKGRSGYGGGENGKGQMGSEKEEGKKGNQSRSKQRDRMFLPCSRALDRFDGFTCASITIKA